MVANVLKWIDEKVSFKAVAILNAIGVLSSSFVMTFSKYRLMQDINAILLLLNGICFVYMFYMYNKYERKLLVKSKKEKE